jgi:hypothetical protein
VSKFRILSIFLAVGLLVGALGVGPVLAGQIDVTGLDTRDASYAPAALTVKAGEVEWTMPDGEDVKYANDEQMAVFYINDDDLETTSEEHIATWDTEVGETNGVTEGFNVLTGHVASITEEHVVTAPALEEDGVATSTFLGYAGNNPIHTVTEMIAVVDAGGDNAATSTLTAQALVAPSDNLVKVLGGTEGVQFNFVEIKFLHHVVDSPPRRARVVSDSDPQGEYVTIGEVGAVGSTDPNASKNIYRGQIMLSDDPANRGPGEAAGAVWVQDGDTLTVHYLDEDGDIVDSDSIIVDAAAPVIDSITPADGTHTSTVNPTLQFDATDEGSGYNATAPAGFFDVYVGSKLHTMGENEGELVALDAALGERRKGHPQDGVRLNADDNDFQLSPVPISDGYRVIFTTADPWLDKDVFGDFDDSGQLYVTLVARDIAGNESITTVSVTIDVSDPTVSQVGGAKTGIGWDSVDEEETTGVANGVKLVMSEPIDPDTVDAADFEIGGQRAAEAVVGTDDFKHVIYLTTQSDLAPDARPDVEVVGEITDLSGNELDITESTAEFENAADGLKPTATVTRDNALLAAKDDEVTITIESDEKLKSDGGAVVSIFGPDSGTAANLPAKMADAEEPQVHSLTHSIGAVAATGKYGISVKVTDLGNNDSTNLTKVTDEEADVEVVEGKHTITVANGPIGDANVDGKLNGMDVSVVVLDKDGVEVATSTEPAAQVAAIDASKRTIVIAGVSGGVKAKVTYSHPSADHTFEVDQDGPGVSFSITDEAKITNNSPFVKVSFDDDEYPGDSYTDVSLAAATLTMGDDETDISGDFAVEANGHNYLWAGVNLALGEYTLAVTGEDTAGNSTDGELTFTIIERPATQIALNPGVNLISLPGNPATTSIEGVITNPDVTAVLTYDPSTPTKWLAAEKAPDGSWVGNLTEISGSLGYWVTTTSFDALSVDIVSFSAGGAALPPTHNLVPGWNLVPVTVLTLENEDMKEVSATADAAPVDANTYLGNNWLRAITYDSASGRFVSIGPDDEETPVLTVGKGYFVWMTKAHTVVP